MINPVNTHNLPGGGYRDDELGRLDRADHTRYPKPDDYRVLVTADKWGIEDLYEPFLQEFKRKLTASNCTEALVWSMTKGTVETSETARAFFVKHRHDVKQHAADTLHLLKSLASEQMHELLLAMLAE